jgi:predicted NBD/HSP70 family sugar kinase
VHQNGTGAQGGLQKRMNVGIRHDDLRRRNRAMVIAAVRRAVQPSRTEIATTTALSHSTISTITSDLITEGVLVENRTADGGSAKRGRPQVAVKLNPHAGSIVAVVLSMNTLSANLIDYAGMSVASERRHIPTLELGRDQLIAEVIQIAGRAMDAAPTRPQRIVLAIQGITDAAERKLLWSPILPHLDIDFSDLLEDRFGVAVAVENDCNMIAEGLRWHDPQRYGRDFIAVLLSHGIGMGMMLRGELFSGTRSSAGEFGHMVHRPNGALCRCGRHGCIEAYAGNYAIWRNAHSVPDDRMIDTDISDSDMRELADRARKGDSRAREAFRIAGEAIGFGLGSLFALIDPAPVAFVGHGAHAFDLMDNPIRKAIAATAGGQHADAIVLDKLTDEAPIILEGCAMRALAVVDLQISAGNTLERLAGLN